MASDSLNLEIGSTNGVRSALATIRAKRESGESASVKKVELRSVGFHFPQPGDPTLWNELFTELGRLSISELKLAPRGCSLPIHMLAETIRQTSGTLVSLNLSDILLEGELDSLIRAIENSSLERFCFFRCRVLRGDAIVAPLIQALSSCSKLRVVQIASVAPFMSRDPLTSPLRDLGMASLQELTLHDFELKGQWISSLFHGLQTNSSLKVLELRNNFNRLEKQGVEAMGHMMLTNSTLEDLSVSVSKTSLIPLANALKVNRTLTSLRLETSLRLPKEDSRLLASILEDNHILVNLRARAALSYTRIIQFHLNLNRAGRGSLLMGAPQNSWIDTIIAFSDDVNVLFWVLQKNPMLCQRALDCTEKQQHSRKRSRPMLTPSASLYQRALSAAGILRPKKRRKL